MRKARLYRKEGDMIRCELCARQCAIPKGSTGFCRTRVNVKGILYTKTYGRVYSSGIDPIEKKPLYHFAPGSRTLSVSSLGCTFACKFCCNYQLSQEWTEIEGEEMEPQDIVDLAISNGCQGISFTYMEPTVFFEFACDTFKLARKAGLYTTLVTNGYMTPKAIKIISKYLDAVTVDFKGSANAEFYREFMSVQKVQPIFDALLAYKEAGVHIEVTDLLVPKFGDSMEDLRKLAVWIRKNLGAETPFHILQFFPSYKLQDVPRTPAKTLDNAYEIAKEEGLRYVYLGNVSSPKENTYCSNCGTVAVKRTIMGITSFHLGEDMKCKKCKNKIPIFGVRWILKSLLRP